MILKSNSNKMGIFVIQRDTEVKKESSTELVCFFSNDPYYFESTFPGKQLNVSAFSEASESRVIMEHSPKHNKIYSIFKELQCPDNTCQRYVMEVN